MNTASTRLSPWSVLAFVLSLGLCPLVTVVALPVGLWALRDCARGRRGKRLAWAALLIALVVTPLTTAAGWWWDRHVREPLMDGPALVIRQGQMGDVSGFLAAVGGGDQHAAQQFLTHLTRALGLIRSTRPSDEPAPSESDPQAVGWAIRVRYEAMFDNGAALIEGRFRLTGVDGWATRFDAFMVDMPDGTILEWPAGWSSTEHE